MEHKTKMAKQRIVVMYGGKADEHSISCISAAGVLRAGRGGVGALARTASQGDQQERPRAAALRIVVASADACMATLEMPVTQNAAYDYCDMYGAAADAPYM